MGKKKRKQVAWGYAPFIKVGTSKAKRLTSGAVPKSMAEALIATKKSTRHIKYEVRKVPIFENEKNPFLR